MNLGILLSLVALIFAIGHGIGQFIKGHNIWVTQTYTYKIKLRPIALRRTGENTRPYALAMLIAGIINLLIIIILLINSIYDPLALVIYPLVGGGFVEVIGLEISERRFRSEPSE